MKFYDNKNAKYALYIPNNSGVYLYFNVYYEKIAVIGIHLNSLMSKVIFFII